MTRNSPSTSTRSARVTAMKKTANTITNDKSGRDTGAKATDKKMASSATPVKKVPAKKAASRPAEIAPAQVAPPEPAADAPIESSAVQESTSALATEPRPAAVPVAPDSRLPPVGTILRRIDRHGQVKAACTIEVDGFTYQGHKYKSLSAAAIAAAKALGLTSTTQNGYAFWQLAKPAPRVTTKGSIDLETLERAWDRYRTRIEAVVKAVSTDDKVRLRELLAGHATTLRGLTTDPVITATAERA